MEKHYKIYCNSDVFSSSYFALQKLKKEAAEDGAFLICWSAVNYDYLMLVVHKKNEVILLKKKKKEERRIYDVFTCHYFVQNGSAQNHKQFQIQHKGSKFCLDGWDLAFSSVKELTDSLKSFVLMSGSESFIVKKCCLPRHGGL